MFNGFFQSNSQYVNALSTQLSDAQSQLSNLQALPAYYANQLQQKQQEIDDTESTIYDAEQQHISVAGNLSDAQSLMQQKQSQLYDLSEQLNNFQISLNVLNDQIQLLEDTIDATPPEPQYAEYGLYCINGILNCTNHPPRIVLTDSSQSAITAFQRNVYQATMRQEPLIRQRDDLSGQYIQLQNNYYQFQSKLQAAQNNVQTYQEYVTALDQAIRDNIDLSTQKRQEYADLLQENSLLNGRITQAQYAVNNLSQQLSQAQASTTSNPVGSSIIIPQQESGASNAYSYDDLKRLAIQELSQEAGVVSDEVSTMTNTVGRVAQNLRQDIRDVRNAVGNVLNTAGNLYNSPNFLVNAMFDGPQIRQLRREQGENVPDSTGNLLIDQANLNYQQNDRR